MLLKDVVSIPLFQERMTMARTIKLYKVEPQPKIEGLRPMEKEDVSQVWLRLSSIAFFCVTEKSPTIGQALAIAVDSPLK